MDERPSQMLGLRVALTVLPFLALFLALGLMASYLAASGDLARTSLFVRCAAVLVLLVVALLVLIVLLASRAKRQDPDPERLPAMAIVTSSWRRSSANGTLTVEDGGLVFCGDRFDFRLTKSLVDAFYRSPELTAIQSLVIGLPLPEFAGGASLRITVSPSDRSALPILLRGIKSEDDPVLPPLYEAAGSRTVRGGWWIVAIFVATILAGMTLQPRSEGWKAIPIAAAFGWVCGPGLNFAQHLSQRAGERAFRRLQAREGATP